MARLTVYKSDQCGACKRIVPIIKKNAKARGDKVKIVDIDNCPSKECEKIAFTPTVLRDGKQLSDREMEALLK
jgi:thiol-disulfide isomerase/thioredoxin